MSNDSDAGLVLAVRAGDTEAYASLVRRHQAAAWQVIAALLRERHQTEDLVQQVFIKAFGALESFDVQRPFSPWIREIARNEARQELRRLEREGRRLNFYQQHLLTTIGGEHEEARRARLEEQLKRCREKLSPQVLEVLDWRYGNGWGFVEIAQRLGRTVEATRQLLARARLVLRDCVSRSGGAA
jgi:RNA polymerase sigma-70 factor (ECF subfamily)